VADFLFELGVEEVPVKDILNIITFLKDEFSKKLKAKQVNFKSIETTATNRRFMIYIHNINMKTADSQEQVRGPAKTIAYAKDNEPTLALKKFISKHDVILSDLIEIETDKGTYLGFTKQTKGIDTREILKRVIPEILKSLPLSSSMFWNKTRIPFIRPIVNILALFNNKLITFEFSGIISSNYIRGHHLLSEGFFEVNSFKDYCELLNKNFVIISEDERKKKIVDEIQDVEDDLHAYVKIDIEMLDYYIYTNEYPVVFMGKFDKKFLSLPIEIISAFMVHQKKLLLVYDRHNQLMNRFVGISNIPDENKHVEHGNEKMIQAAFENAKILWDKDRKADFLSLRNVLKTVSFHKNLGSYFEKTNRLIILIDFLISETRHEELRDSLIKAAHYCKNDLTTGTVREFPILQGIIGGLCLKENGADENLWKSVYGHYEPRGYDNIKLEHVGAALLSIADKMDNIAGFIGQEVNLSSSRDPFGIRRDANAIIKLIIDFNLNFAIESLIKIAVACFERNEKDMNELIIKIKALFLSRLGNVLKDVHQIRYDIINSVMNVQSLDISKTYLQAMDVTKMLKSDAIVSLISFHKRLKNIIKKYKPYNVSESYLEKPEEKVLFEIFKESKPLIEKNIQTGKYIQACTHILEMKPIIDTFFNKITIICDDPQLKANRIGLLQKINDLILKIADFSSIRN
jgi:glycyl-tRNA synthetase beta chain